ncbi:unnamed protein product [Rhizophagus irregularis]|uniref:Uncharacterized protein n=1 Tax=Rhizophagus irregularis TaxID=588596 RepID=A0A915ZLW6_9GLOM|nr:unnamed protein product [Rhizophagus irregularis]
MFNNTIMKINGVHFGVKEKNVDPDPHIYSFWNDEVTRAQKLEEDSSYLDDLNLIYIYILVQNYKSKYTQILEIRVKTINNYYHHQQHLRGMKNVKV